MSAAAATFAIPCHNGARHLEPLLRSLLAQTRQDFELLLVDDASSDDSLALAARIAGDRLRVAPPMPRAGIAANFARAAALVTTPHFCLAHQDDVYEPAYLERMLAALQSEPSAPFVHCSATAIDGDGNAITAAAERFKRRLAERAADESPAQLYRLLWRGNFVCCPSVLFRTGAFRAIAGFRADLSFALDWELWFRFARAGQRFVTVLEPLVRYRRHAANATTHATRSLRRFEEELQVLKEAHAAGVAAGLLDGERAPGRSLRNNLVNEAYEDLRAGDRGAFRSKIAFVMQRVPELQHDRYVLALRLLGRCGPVGVSALGVLRGLAVRLGLG